MRWIDVEKRNGRWHRRDTGAQCTDDELHRAYYLGALRGQLVQNAPWRNLTAVLSIPDQLGEFLAWDAEHDADVSEYLFASFAEWKAAKEAKPQPRTFKDDPLYRQFDREARADWEEDQTIRFEAWRDRQPDSPMH